MKEKILKWQAEIENILQKKMESNKNYDEKIKELKNKIKEAEEQIRRKENEEIISVFRKEYGNASRENILEFQDMLSRFRKEKEENHQTE